MAQANERCEYCLTARQVIGMPLVLDHILPRALGGGNEPENLCAACYRCNQYKAAKSHEFDPASGELAPLFHPRRDVWTEHFVWANGGTHIIGLTSTGRATVIALRMNNDYIVEARRLWIARQWHPPV
jgi:hypothetical protein